MTSIITNVTTNKSGIIVRGVRILRSGYDRASKRDKLQYLGTMPQGLVDVPPDFAKLLSQDEQAELEAKLIIAAKSYWQQRIELLATELEDAKSKAAALPPLESVDLGNGA